MVILPDVRSVENILSPFVKFHDERADDGDKCKKQSYFDKHHKPRPIGGHYSPFVRGSVHKVPIVDNFAINAMWGISAALRVGASIRARRLNVGRSPPTTNFLTRTLIVVTNGEEWISSSGLFKLKPTGANHVAGIGHQPS